MEWKVINRFRDGRIIEDLSKVVLPKELQRFLDDAFRPENFKREASSDEELQRKTS